MRMDHIKEIKSLLKSGKLVFGVQQALKEIAGNGLNKVYIASNCSEEAVKSIEHAAGFNETEVIRLNIPNEELGIVCRKLFSISVLGIRK